MSRGEPPHWRPGRRNSERNPTEGKSARQQETCHPPIFSLLVPLHVPPFLQLKAIPTGVLSPLPSGFLLDICLSLQRPRIQAGKRKGVERPKQPGEGAWAWEYLKGLPVPVAVSPEAVAVRTPLLVHLQSSAGRNPSAADGCLIISASLRHHPHTNAAPFQSSQRLTPNRPGQIPFHAMDLPVHCTRALLA